MKKLFIFWLPVIIWSSVIYFFSSIPHLKIEILGFWDLILRKIAHIVEYAILSLLYFRAIKNTTNLKGTSFYFWPMFLSLIYAISDEIHQHFVPGRYCSVVDIGIDSVGIIIGCVIYTKFFK